MEDSPQLAFTATHYAGRIVSKPVSLYRYSPLSERNNEFRLVRLEPSRDPTTPIRASLQHYSLLNPPPYVAVSYEVGNPELFHVITLDGIQVPVSPNLFAALCQFRHHAFLLLWIDSLCIDQRSDEEKSSQILRIQAIYQEARQVAVWLGPESHGSWKVMRHIRASGKKQSRASRMPLNRFDEYDKSLVPELQHFFLRTYWNRVWMIQEIVAGSHVTLFCGGERAEWEDLEVLVHRLRENGLRDTLTTEEVECLMKFRNDNIDGCSMSMLEILHRSSFSQSTYAKDKIYALLRIAFDRSTFLSEPKYGWADEELCMRMTKSFISSKRSLDIMFVARKSQRSTLRLPSWCPDYTCFPSWPQMRPVVKYVSRQDERIRLGHLGRRWKTTDDTTLTNELYAINQGILRVRGAHVATINSLAHLSSERKIPSTEKEWRAMLRHPSGIKASEKEMRALLERPDDRQRDALARVLFMLYNKDYPRLQKHPRVANHLLFGFDSEDYEREALPAFDSIKEWRSVNSHFRANGWPLQVLSKGRKPKPLDHDKIISKYGKEGSESRPYGDPASMLLAIGELAALALVDRDASLAEGPSVDLNGALTTLSDLIAEELRLMSTQEGHLGWAHPLAMPGDRIYLLAGCSMPAILRQHPTIPGAFRVVGHAYVDGMMDGTFWMNCVDKGLHTVDIC